MTRRHSLQYALRLSPEIHPLFRDLAWAYQFPYRRIESASVRQHILSLYINGLSWCINASQASENAPLFPPL
jgi:hypothetical protein